MLQRTTSRLFDFGRQIHAHDDLDGNLTAPEGESLMLEDMLFSSFTPPQMSPSGMLEAFRSTYHPVVAEHTDCISSRSCLDIAYLA